MKVLIEAIRSVLLAAAPGTPPVATLPGGTQIVINGGIRVGHISDPDIPPDRPIITILRQGGASPLPIAGADEPFMLVEVWGRKSVDEVIDLYEWVSAHINQRRAELTAAMADKGLCWTFQRTWRADGLFEPTTHEWYTAARYYAKAVDFADLHSAFGG